MEHELPRGTSPQMVGQAVRVFPEKSQPMQTPDKRQRLDAMNDRSTAGAFMIRLPA